MKLDTMNIVLSGLFLIYISSYGMETQKCLSPIQQDKIIPSEQLAPDLAKLITLPLLFAADPLREIPKNSQQMAIYFEVTKCPISIYSCDTYINTSQDTVIKATESMKKSNQDEQKLLQNKELQLRAQLIELQQEKVKLKTTEGIPSKQIIVSKKSNINVVKKQRNIPKAKQSQSPKVKPKIPLNSLFEKYKVRNALELKYKLKTLTHNLRNDQEQNNKKIGPCWDDTYHCLIQQINKTHILIYSPCTNNYYIGNESFLNRDTILHTLPDSFFCSCKSKNGNTNARFDSSDENSDSEELLSKANIEDI